MRVTLQSPDTLVVEDGAIEANWFGPILTAASVIAIVIGLTIAANWLIVIAGSVFALAGLKIIIFGRTISHRFERNRGVVTIETKNRWRSARRELRLDDISDIVLNEIRRKGGAELACQVFYVTRAGERLPWAEDHRSSKHDNAKCWQAAREFLGMAAPTPAD